MKRTVALWVACGWLFLASSRNPTGWLQAQQSKGSADTAYDSGSAFDRNILTALMLGGVIVLTSRSERSIAFLKANLPIVLFFVYCGMSAAWSDHPDISIKRWFRGLGDLVMVMVILTDRDWVRAFRWVYTRLACVLMPLSVLFFRWFPGLGRSYDIHDGHVTVTGVTDDKNLLGAICALFSLSVIWCVIDAIQNSRPRKKWFLAGYLFVIANAFYLVYLANSATATAVLVQGAIVLILTSLPKVYRRRARIHWIAGGILGFSALNLFFGSTLLQMLGRNSTLTGRTELWRLCLTLVRNPLVGEGYESFWLGDRLERMWQYIPGVNQAHNGYLEIYLNLGWVGVILLVAFLIFGYRNITRAVGRHEPAANLRLALFVVSCIANCTEAGFKMMHPMWFAMLVVATYRPAMGFVKRRRLAQESEEQTAKESEPEFTPIPLPS
ncbi:MAG TPA: O-antigen ligase family protein [Silvibacterium sp.]|nr:O-antigen ligase family protein [Silvibacterium sp.]